jgi:FkbM family methyltransferase
LALLCLRSAPREHCNDDAAAEDAIVREPEIEIMASPPRPIAFVLASTDHGTMILNRYDQMHVGPGQGYGVSFNLLNRSKFDPAEAALVMALLDARRRHFGDGVTALDLGANIGVFTVEWARHMTGWGSVVAVEAQERIFHALAGNVAINNCFNAHPLWAAVTSEAGWMRIPVPNYLAPASFGSLPLRPGTPIGDFGQAIDYSTERTMPVRAISIDSLGLNRLDLIKADVEGMEMEVLQGARQAIGRFLPMLVVEHIKTDRDALHAYLDSFGYVRLVSGLDTVAIHPSDPALEELRGILPATT